MLKRAHICWVLAAAALVSTHAKADDTDKQASASASVPARKTDAITKTSVDPSPDDELLEFLGSVDSEDAEWNEYLTHTDIAAAAKNSSSEPRSR